jgi:hypothetical protein
MRELGTIQTMSKLNRVFAVDEPGAGGANHKYMIIKNDVSDEPLNLVTFQHGPRNEESSTSGILDMDLLEIVRDRLKAFQEGPYSSDYNERALKGVEDAINALNDRVIDRMNRNVLGTNEK